MDDDLIPHVDESEVASDGLAVQVEFESQVLQEVSSCFEVCEGDEVRTENCIDELLAEREDREGSDVRELRAVEVSDVQLLRFELRNVYYREDNAGVGDHYARLVGYYLRYRLSEAETHHLHFLDHLA